MASSMTVQFLDVGMGDGTLVQVNPSGKIWDQLILVDFGEKRTQFKNPYKEAIQYLVETIAANSELRDAPPVPGVPFVDYLILTHPDGDHYNKLPELISADYPGFPGKKLHFGEVFFSGEAAEYGTLLTKDLAGLVKKKPIAPLPEGYHSPIVGTTVTPTFTCGPVKGYFLSSNWPSRNSKLTNRKSIVTKLSLGTKNVILPGDATKETERAIIETFKDVPSFLQADVVKLGHHGSKESSCEEWVAVTKPKAIFSSGDAAWAHPYCEAICRFVNASPSTLTTYWTKEDVWYCCGNAGLYWNNPTRLAIGMNLFYTVPTDTQLLWDREAKKDVAGFLNNAFGVQWAASLQDGKSLELAVTAMTVPKSGKSGYDPWDCAAPPHVAAPLPACEMDAGVEVIGAHV